MLLCIFLLNSVWELDDPKINERSNQFSKAMTDYFAISQIVSKNRNNIY